MALKIRYRKLYCATRTLLKNGNTLGCSGRVENGDTLGCSGRVENGGTIGCSGRVEKGVHSDALDG